MAAESAQKKCSQCRKPGDGICRYCGQGFCREHMKAKASSAQMLLHDDIPEKLKDRLGKEAEQAGGHVCRPYLESLLGNPTKKENTEKERPAPREKRHAGQKKEKRHRSLKKPAFIIILAVALFSFFWFRLDAVLFQLAGSCNDGTPEGSCSMSMPYYCTNGTLVERSSVCGCPEGHEFRGERCGLPDSCIDGTSLGQCSLNKPFFCLNGDLVTRASMCGCPEYSRPAWAGAAPKWNITSLLSIGCGNSKWYKDKLTFAISNSCSELEKSRMRQSFSYLLASVNTSLSFTEVTEACPDITVNCVAGGFATGLEEGIAEAKVMRVNEGYYNVIAGATITLSTEASLCMKPDVQVHMILHAFGFGHTADPTDIMYERLGCQKEIKPSVRSDLAQIYPK